jgi:hypothetical protein
MCMHTSRTHSFPGFFFFFFSRSVCSLFKFRQYFKWKFAQWVGEETAKQNKNLLYICASASAEFIAEYGFVIASRFYGRASA